jgi:hypothetical protein
MHVPTGIFVTLAGGEGEEDGDDSGEYWFVQAGVEKRWFSYGATTVYGDYGDYDGFAVGASRSGDGDLLDIFVSSSEAHRWGFGVVQSYDAAAMDIYANVAFWDFDWSESDATSFSSDISTVMVGARIRF